MPHEQLTMRFLSGVAGVELSKIRESWRIEDTDWTLIGAQVARIADMPLWIDDTPSLSAMDIKGRCLRLSAEISKEFPQGIRLVVIDYAQLMGSDVAGGSNRDVQIGDASRKLKELAKVLGCPVVLLSQVNRNCEARPNRRPILADLRESGSLEQDSDIVFFVYRDEVYNDDSLDRGVAEVIIAKQRNGPLGTVRLGFEGQFSRFRNLAKSGY
jgi:replicative DNA helicase